MIEEFRDCRSLNLHPEENLSNEELRMNVPNSRKNAFFVSFLCLKIRFRKKKFVHKTLPSKKIPLKIYKEWKIFFSFAAEFIRFH